MTERDPVKDPDPYCIAEKRLPDGRWLQVLPLLGGRGKLAISRGDPMVVGQYEDEW